MPLRNCRPCRCQSSLHGCWEAEASGLVRIAVDAGFRRLMCELHTLAHIANGIVFQTFDGALLMGAQLSGDGTFRLDFDLPVSDADRLRMLAGPINDVIRVDLPITAFLMSWDAANAVPGLFRSKAVSPPRQADGNVRIVEIGDIDQQGCGGTHLKSTGEARPVRIVKRIEELTPQFLISPDMKLELGARGEAPKPLMQTLYVADGTGSANGVSGSQT
ncbi:hypothetical protein M1D34_26830 (plasmid) [Ensifer sp. D2-11]